MGAKSCNRLNTPSQPPFFNYLLTITFHTQITFLQDRYTLTLFGTYVNIGWGSIFVPLPSFYTEYIGLRPRHIQTKVIWHKMDSHFYSKNIRHNNNSPKIDVLLNPRNRLKVKMTFVLPKNKCITNYISTTLFEYNFSMFTTF